MMHRLLIYKDVRNRQIFAPGKIYIIAILGSQSLLGCTCPAPKLPSLYFCSNSCQWFMCWIYTSGEINTLRWHNTNTK